jgi:hypothetical protein
MSTTKRANMIVAFFLLLGWRSLAQPSLDQPALTPAENLIVDGIPSIPASIPARANRYTESRSAAVFAWHPQRREMLIGTRFADTVQVHELKSPGAARTQLTFLSGPDFGRSLTIPARATILFSARTSAAASGIQLFRYDCSSGRDHVVDRRKVAQPWTPSGLNKRRPPRVCFHAPQPRGPGPSTSWTRRIKRATVCWRRTRAAGGGLLIGRPTTKRSWRRN